MKVSVFKKIVKECIREVLREEGVLTESRLLGSAKKASIPATKARQPSKSVDLASKYMSLKKKEDSNPYEGASFRGVEEEEFDPSIRVMERIAERIPPPKVEKKIVNGEEYVSGKNILEWVANSLPTNSIPSIVDEEVSEGIDELIDKTLKPLAPRIEL